MTLISFTVTARSVEVTANGDTPLLDVLRNYLGLTSTRFGVGLDNAELAWV
jgi:aerobic-type carbon monoxide dehydrogenase small subunit (CoxS/CutS family)